MRRLFRFLLGLAACGVLVFAASHLVAYVQESRQSTNLKENLIEKAVVMNAPAPQPTEGEPLRQPEADAQRLPEETAPIAVDFAALRETNQDVVDGFTAKIHPSTCPWYRRKTTITICIDSWTAHTTAPERCSWITETQGIFLTRIPSSMVII